VWECFRVLYQKKPKGGKGGHDNTKLRGDGNERRRKDGFGGRGGRAENRKNAGLLQAREIKMGEKSTGKKKWMSRITSARNTKTRGAGTTWCRGRARAEEGGKLKSGLFNNDRVKKLSGAIDFGGNSRINNISEGGGEKVFEGGSEKNKYEEMSVGAIEKLRNTRSKQA